MKINSFDINIGINDGKFIYTDFKWEPKPLKRPTKIVIHHTGNSFKTLYETYRMGIERFGQPSYHYIIDNAGNIYQTLTLNMTGAHVKNHNSDSIGIALLNLMPLKPPTLAMRYSLSQLIKFLRMQYKPLTLTTHFKLLLDDVNSTVKRCNVDFPEINERYYVKQGFRELTILSVENFKNHLTKLLDDTESDKLSKEMIALSIQRIKNCPGHLSHVLL